MSYKDIDRLGPEEIQSRISSIKKMLMMGAGFAVVGFILIIGALVLELTSFHPAIDEFLSTHTDTSLAGGGSERGADENELLSTIHKYPSLLMWMKLGGVGHILMGIFIALASIVRTLALMPHRLGHEMERAQNKD